MWILLSKLFGCDYVHVSNSADAKICRVKTAPNGAFIFQPYSWRVLVIHEPLPLSGKTIGGWVVVPLTPNVTAKG